MSSYLYPLEVYSTANSNYMLIHKNGCNQVRHHLYTNFKQVEYLHHFPSNKINWTTIRDPYERFISGLTYDILKQFQNLDNLSKILNIKNIKYFFYENTFINRTKGNVNHTTPQWVYLHSQPIDFFVKINDLDLFLDLHFKVRSNNESTNTSKQSKKIVRNFINNNKKLKRLIKAYLAPDYFYLEKTTTKELIWKWQNGKIF